ncbi:MAG: DNA polymerase-1 [Glaciecola sp.]
MNTIKKAPNTMDKDKQPSKLYLLDAFALIYRAYFSMIRNPMINSKGVNTSAIYGFINTLWGLIQKENPTHMAVVFDTAAPTTRVEEHSFYKANRQETPEDIRSSIQPIKDLIKAFNIPVIECDGYEADDIIGTLAKEAEKHGHQTFMVTPDKDYGQLVSENIFMYKPGSYGKDREILGVPEILAKWDIERIDQVIDMLGLMGDAVDNIPGIKGVGEKTACKLLKQYDSVEGILEHAHEVKGKMGEKIVAGKEDAIMSKMLATIILDVPVKFDEKDLLIEDPNAEALRNFFDEFEFRTLGKRILGDGYSFAKNQGSQPSLFDSVPEENIEESNGMKTLSDVDSNYHFVEIVKDRRSLIAKLMKAKEVCFDTETSGIEPSNTELVGLSFSMKKGEAYYVPTPTDQKETQSILEEFRPFFSNEKITKIGHNIKFDMIVLMQYNIKVAGKIEDSMIAHSLLEPEKRHGMDFLSENFLSYAPVSITTLIGKKGKNQKSMRDIEQKEISDYACEDADITLQLHQLFAPLLKKNEVDELYQNVECPLIKVLAEMEFRGVGLDVDFLNKYATELGADILVIRDRILERAGTDFNLNSPKQLGEVLFEKMEIPYKGKKTATGQYSTNEATLSKLKSEYEIIGDIMEYRELTKLKSTYVEALPKLINPKDSRIHTSFRQAIVPTGRLSSDSPNLQNIPIRSEKGRKIRTAFKPTEKDYVLLAADYSQVELRVIASLSDEKNMIQAFVNDEDIHSATAAKLFSVDLKDVDRTMRSKAKAVNFGLIYGQGAYGLSQNLGIKVGEAKEIIQNYFEKYPGIITYMNSNQEFARENGYVKTLLGRRRYLPDINSANHTVRSHAERNAINTPIQGSAADIIKVAMIDIENHMQNKNMQSRMVLQVHDELVFEVHNSELDEMKEMVSEKMMGAVDLKVPLKVDVGVGSNWLEAH